MVTGVDVVHLLSRGLKGAELQLLTGVAYTLNTPFSDALPHSHTDASQDHLTKSLLGSEGAQPETALCLRMSQDDTE